MPAQRTLKVGYIVLAEPRRSHAGASPYWAPGVPRISLALFHREISQPSVSAKDAAMDVPFNVPVMLAVCGPPYSCVHMTFRSGLAVKKPAPSRASAAHAPSAFGSVVAGPASPSMHSRMYCCGSADASCWMETVSMAVVSAAGRASDGGGPDGVPDGDPDGDQDGVPDGEPDGEPEGEPGAGVGMGDCIGVSCGVGCMDGCCADDVLGWSVDSAAGPSPAQADSVIARVASTTAARTVGPWRREADSWFGDVIAGSPSAGPPA